MKYTKKRLVTVTFLLFSLFVITTFAQPTTFTFVEQELEFPEASMLRDASALDSWHHILKKEPKKKLGEKCVLDSECSSLYCKYHPLLQLSTCSHKKIGELCEHNAQCSSGVCGQYEPQFPKTCLKK